MARPTKLCATSRAASPRPLVPLAPASLEDARISDRNRRARVEHDVQAPESRLSHGGHHVCVGDGPPFPSGERNRLDRAAAEIPDGWKTSLPVTSPPDCGAMIWSEVLNCEPKAPASDPTPGTTRAVYCVVTPVAPRAELVGVRLQRIVERNRALDVAGVQEIADGREAVVRERIAAARQGGHSDEVSLRDRKGGGESVWVKMPVVVRGREAQRGALRRRREGRSGPVEDLDPDHGGAGKPVHPSFTCVRLPVAVAGREVSISV